MQGPSGEHRRAVLLNTTRTFQQGRTLRWGEESAGAPCSGRCREAHCGRHLQRAWPEETRAGGRLMRWIATKKQSWWTPPSKLSCKGRSRNRKILATSGPGKNNVMILPRDMRRGTTAFPWFWAQEFPPAPSVAENAQSSRPFSSLPRSLLSSHPSLCDNSDSRIFSGSVVPALQ